MAVGLYDHQKKAVASLKSGAILCGGVGSGKSRTALAYFYTKECGGKLPEYGGTDYPHLPYPKDLYIITTAKKRDSLEWHGELIPFLLSTEEAIGPVKVVIDSWNNIKKYTGIKDAFFILDEQRLVGYGTWVKSFLKIAHANHWILLSATPGDTWMDYLPVFVANGFYKNKTEFVDRHVIYSRYSTFPKVDRYLGTAQLAKLKNSILVPMDYHREATPHHLWIKTGYDEDDYDQVWNKRWDIFSNKPIKNYSAACYLIRKVVNGDRRRIEALNNLYKKHSRLIIFYNFNYELDMLCTFAEKEEIPYSQWNGKKHEPIGTGRTWLYFVQYAAGCEGWNCVETNALVFFSQNYSYRVCTQAAGRIDRLNTKFTDLYYYHFFSDSKIDNGIKSSYNRKKTFNEKNFIEKEG